MNECPLVSIGIPTYNRPQGLVNALDCFLSQSYENLEIIVADNHSNIDPRSYIRSDVLDDPRVKFFRHDKNFGMSFNSEFVWRAARGKYFILGSDDDWWDPIFVNTLVELLETNTDSSIAMSNFTEVDFSGKKLTHRSVAARIKNIFGYGLPPFPDHLPLLNNLSNKSLVSRLCSFIDQNEYDGKANIHRALCRRNDFIESIDRLYMLNLNGCWGFDQLIAFALLSKGNIKISPKILFKCTVGNQKNYVDSRSKLEFLQGYYLISKACMDNEALLVIKKHINMKFLKVRCGFFAEFDEALKNYLHIISGYKYEEMDNRYQILLTLISQAEYLECYDLICSETKNDQTALTKEAKNIQMTLYKNLKKQMPINLN